MGIFLLILRCAGLLAAIGYGINFGVSVGKNNSPGLGVVAAIIAVIVLVIVVVVVNNWLFHLYGAFNEWNSKRKRGY